MTQFIALAILMHITRYSQNKVTYEFLLRIHASKSSNMPNTSQVVPADEMWVTGQLGEVGVLPLSFSLF